jgi:membrane-associated phospholipid phosphatase
MDLTPVADVISLSVFVAFALVAVFGVLNPYMKTGFVILIGIAILILVSIGYIKDLIADPRPEGASNCGLFNEADHTSNGMPSAHMAVLTFLLAVLLVFFPNKKFNKTILWVVAGLWLAAMAWARSYKQCHTLLQLVGGVGYGFTFVLGTVFALLVYIAVYATTCTRCVT